MPQSALLVKKPLADADILKGQGSFSTGHARGGTGSAPEGGHSPFGDQVSVIGDQERPPDP